MPTWWRLRGVEACPQERRRGAEARRGHRHGNRKRRWYQAYRGDSRLSHRDLEQKHERVLRFIYAAETPHSQGFVLPVINSVTSDYPAGIMFLYVHFTKRQVGHE